MKWDLPTLLEPVGGRKRFHQPLARYSSFRIGGSADALVLVEDIENLKTLQAIALAHDIPLFILGGGSNLLIRDGGIRGIVVAMRGTFRTCRVVPCADEPESGCQRAEVHAGAGCSLSRLAMQLAQQSWSGLEFAYGIPGTLGGAMIMNAGTHLGDLSQVVIAAQVLLASGRVETIPSQDLGLRYRGSSYPAASIVVGATLRVQQGNRDTIESAMRESNERRQRTQPLWLPNAGSIFKNPPGTAAARLIDELGLKGTRIGGAMISPVHANFLVNVDGAKATDVEALMQLIRTRVYEAYGIELEPEVRIVGEEG
ncbi:UDP-N-acetylmuramate dehydrogenase [Candidatus Entotheonella palauensis]|uniref:UDP-N-acetylmuramate dehydrogenase n=1 Tax=Candidatus Entotheonella palauensis TaxID=93172 RepID=UPI0015C45316|nr:UDP-N-acetylmuramate dehydrogenase [Candidatus Entotheonella palauensis]